MSTPDARRHDTTTRIVLTCGALVLAGAACGVATLVLDTLILWAHSTGCEPGPADPDQVLAGQTWMGVVLVVVTGLWVLAWVRLAAYRTTVVVSGLMAVVPALGYLAFGLDPASWVGGFCIPF